jgi:hypothetical protein
MYFGKVSLFTSFDHPAVQARTSSWTQWYIGLGYVKLLVKFMAHFRSRDNLTKLKNAVL